MKTLLLTLLLVPMISIGQNRNSRKLNGVNFSKSYIHINELAFVPWINVSDFNSVDNLFRIDLNNCLYLCGDIIFKLSKNSIDFNIDQSLHVTGKYDFSQLKLFTSGALDEHYEINNRNLTPYIGIDEKFYLGTSKPLSDNIRAPMLEFFHGNIDDANAWLRVLNQSPIQQYIKSPESGFKYY
ncbi:MAG: hypothetical protein QNK85_02680 [Crocinitomicaceae bacterium]